MKSGIGPIKSFSAALSGLGVNLSALKFAGVIAGVTALVKAYQYLSTADERAIEKHDEAVSSYQETTSEIESLEKEIASYRDELETLNKLKSPTSADQEEIASIESSIALLEKKLEIKKKLQEYEAGQVAETAANALTARSLYITGNNTVTDNGIMLPEFGYRTILDEAETYQNELERLNAQIAQAYDDLGGLNPGTAEYNAQEQFISNLESRALELEGTVSTIQAQILALYESLYNKDTGAVVSGFEDLARRIEIILGFTADEKSAEDAVQGAVATAAASASKSFTAFMNEEVSAGIDKFQSRVSRLSEALASLRDGSMDSSGIVDLLQEFPEFSPYVDMTAENFGELGSAIEDAVHADADSLIETLQEMKDSGKYTEEAKAAIDALCDSLENVSTSSIQDASGQFGVLADAINAAKTAKNELDKALQEEDYDAGYEGRVSAFTGMQEVMSAGEYGSKAYAAYKEYFGLAGQSASEVQAWMNANRQYFTEGTEGVTAFLMKIEELNNSGKLSESIAFFDSATGELRYDINYLEEFADSLGWSEGMLQDFIDKYRMYCEDWVERTTEMNQTEFLGAGIIKETGDGAIASLKDLEKYTNYSSDAAAELIDEINALRASEGMEPIQLIGRDQVHITQEMLNDICRTAEDAHAVIADLASTSGVTFDAGITYGDKTVEEIIAQSTGGDGVVSVDVRMNVNGEEVIQTVTTTADTIKAILGENWEVKLNSGTAEEKVGNLQALVANLVEGSYSVTVGENTSAAEDALTKLSALLDSVIAKSTITISASGSTSDIQSNATGTRHAVPGLSLLGDEYSASGRPRPELVVTSDHAYIAGVNGPEMGYLNAGDVVYTADQTKKILGGVNGSVRRIIPRFALGLNPWVGLDPFEAVQYEGYGGSSGSRYSSGNAGGGPPNLPLHNPHGSSQSGGGGRPQQAAAQAKKTFEELYKEHQHLVAMEKETDAEYLAWLEKAYQDAYKAGEISLDDYRKYAEEVFELQKALFQDSLNDIEHRISILERETGTEAQIIELYLQMIQMIEAEMEAARARGLDDNSDYIQELQDQYYSYQDAIEDIQEELIDNAESAVEDLVDYRIEMLKQELEDEIDILEDRKDALRDFYDEQKEMLQDYIDEEEYLESQREKQKAKSDIEEELAKLEFDDSAWAQKRRLELQEELAEAEKDLNDFERDHAREEYMDFLDEMYERQADQLDDQIDALEERLNDPEALYNQALSDIQNNTLALYEEMVEYNNRHGSGNPEDVKNMWDEAKASLDAFLAAFGEAYKDIILVASGGLGDGYASGTRSAVPGIHAIDERGDEYIFQSGDGTRYRMFSGGEKVLNAKATNFLYDFATTGGEVLGNMVDNLLRSLNMGNISPAVQAVQLSTGDIIVNGSADQRTVSEIRRAQRENIDYVLREFRRLNK